MSAIWDEIRAERARQHRLHGNQSHLPDGTGSLWQRIAAEDRRRECELAFRGGLGSFRHILTEEVAEAFAESDPARLREELIQVAAVAVQWVEAIDGRQS